MKLQAIQAKLTKAKETEQELLKAYETERAKMFQQLPAIVGLKSIDELYEALEPHTSSGLKLRLRIGKRSERVNSKIPSHGVRGSIKGARGERFPVDLMERVRKDMESSAYSMEELAEKYAPAPSIFTLRIWKRKWGLTRKYKRSK